MMEKKENKPWFDEECRNQIEERKQLKSKWLHTQEERDKENYNIQNRKTNKILR